MQNIYSIYASIHSPYTMVQYKITQYIRYIVFREHIYRVSAYTYMYIRTDSSVYTCMCAIYVSNYTCIYIFCGGREVFYFVLT